MSAGKERRFISRVTPVAATRGRVLSFSTVYGANGSGKTNLLKALDLMRSLVLTTTQLEEKLTFDPFKLNSSELNKPTFFEIRFVIDQQLLSYGFSYTSDSIHSEYLKIIDYRKGLRDQSSTLFSRVGNSIESKFPGLSPVEKKDLEVVERTTRPNLLFLNQLFQAAGSHAYSWSALISRVRRWFAQQLVIVSPSSAYSFTDEIETLSKIIGLFDTGIKNIELLEINRSLIDLPDSLLKRLSDSLPEGHLQTFDLPLTDRDCSVVIKKLNGNIKFYRIALAHKGAEGEKIYLDFEEESSGTQRILQLLACLHRLNGNGGDVTVFIDELDRSLHPSLVLKIVFDFLDQPHEHNKSQLVLATHNASLLMNNPFLKKYQEKGIMLRRDEINLLNKTDAGNSRLSRLDELHSASERIETSVQKLFMEGKLGGVPRLGEQNFLIL